MSFVSNPAAGSFGNFVGLCLMLYAGAAAAQPSAEQQNAIRSNCRSDFMSNCSSVQPGGSEALQCLQHNVAKLSLACQRAVRAAMPTQPVTTPAAPAAHPAASHPAAAAPAAHPAAHPVAAVPMGPPSIIYVSDFQLDPAAFHAEHSGPIQQLRPGLLGSMIKGDAGSKDPAERAHGLVDMMSRMVVENLTAAGLNASRLAPGQARPSQGWLVHGAFTTLDEGNKMERSIIGMGKGKTEVKVTVAIDDLRSGQSVYQTNEGAHSSQMPGSAASMAIKHNPYAMAAHMVMSGFDVERDIMKTAREVSDDIARRARQ